MFYLCRPYMVQRLFDIINIAGYIKILEFFFFINHVIMKHPLPLCHALKLSLLVSFVF